MRKPFLVLARVLGLVVFGYLLGYVIYGLEWERGWAPMPHLPCFTPDRYGEIETGMTKEQVLHIAGSPMWTEENDHYERWYYALGGSRHTSLGHRGAVTSENNELTRNNEVWIAFNPSGVVTTIYPGLTAAKMWGKGQPTTGMDKCEVLRLIGKPNRIVRSQQFEVAWEYEWHKGMIYSVAFDSTGRVFSKVRMLSPEARP